MFHATITRKNRPDHPHEYDDAVAMAMMEANSMRDVLKMEIELGEPHQKLDLSVSMSWRLMLGHLMVLRHQLRERLERIEHDIKQLPELIAKHDEYERNAAERQLKNATVE